MNKLLLPYSWKFAGIVLTLSGIGSAILYLWFDFRFSLPVFAVYSSFLETKLFTSFSTNFADELILLLLISGLSLIVFSKDKNESEGLDTFRFKALTKALMVNIIFLLFSILFVYGSGFLAILVTNMISFHIFYLIFFYYEKFRNKS